MGSRPVLNGFFYKLGRWVWGWEVGSVGGVGGGGGVKSTYKVLCSQFSTTSDVVHHVVHNVVHQA